MHLLKLISLLPPPPLPSLTACSLSPPSPPLFLCFLFLCEPSSPERKLPRATMTKCSHLHKCAIMALSPSAPLGWLRCNSVASLAEASSFRLETPPSLPYSLPSLQIAFGRTSPLPVARRAAPERNWPSPSIPAFPKYESIVRVVRGASPLCLQFLSLPRHLVFAPRTYLRDMKAAVIHTL